MSATPDRVAELVAIVDREIDNSDTASLSDADLTRLVNAAVRLHAARCERREERVAFVDLDGLTTTAVLNAACEMLRQVDVNMFDVAMWFSHAGRQ